MEQHHFCDASESGYGACSFLRVSNREGKIRVILVASKAKLGPLKPITVARLELPAAVTAVKLECDKSLQLNLNVTLRVNLKFLCCSQHFGQIV